MARITAGDASVLNELTIYGAKVEKKEIEERIKDLRFSGGFRISIMNIRKPIEFWCNYKN